MNELKTLFEDGYFLVMDKPIGLPVQGNKPGEDSLVERLGGMEKWNGILHRLDTPVSGLVLWAKSPVALERGMELFRHRKVEKTYWAVTEKPLPDESGRLIHFLKHIQAGNKTLISKEEKKEYQRAALDYTLLKKSDRYFLYEVHLLTGRTHQIRAQLSAAGACIKGDVKYGARRSNTGGGIHLLSRKMEFTHPFTKAKMAFIAEPPAGDSLWEYFNKLDGTKNRGDYEMSQEKSVP